MNYVKIIYEYAKEDNNRIVPILKEALVPFCERNTIYLNDISYSDNFDNFLQDAFEGGYIYLNDTHAIPVFNIKSFFAYTSDKTDEKPKDNRPQNQHVSHGKNFKKNKPRRPHDHIVHNKVSIPEVSDSPLKESSIVNPIT